MKLINLLEIIVKTLNKKEINSYVLKNPIYRELFNLSKDLKKDRFHDSKFSDDIRFIYDVVNNDFYFWGAEFEIHEYVIDKLNLPSKNKNTSIWGYLDIPTRKFRVAYSMYKKENIGKMRIRMREISSSFKYRN